jgi:Co/Zn/Cd efflux system component
LLSEISATLEHRHGIGHTTVQVEQTHECGGGC